MNTQQWKLDYDVGRRACKLVLDAKESTRLKPLSYDLQANGKIRAWIANYNSTSSTYIPSSPS